MKKENQLKNIDEMDNKLSCKEIDVKHQEIGDEFPPRLPSQPISIAIDDYSPGNAHSKFALSTEQRAFFNTVIILAS